jgi:uncharacterized protein YbdZ (MbtH family)
MGCFHVTPGEEDRQDLEKIIQEDDRKFTIWRHFRGWRSRCTAACIGYTCQIPDIEGNWSGLRGGNLRCEEVRIVFSGDLASKVSGRKLVLVAFRCLGRERVGLLLQQLERIALVDLLTLSGSDVVADPLPQLASADFGRSSILLQFMR